MVEQRYQAVLTQILDLLNTACQASLELLDRYSSSDTPGDVSQLLSDLYAVVRVVRGTQEPLLPDLEHAYTSEILENVEDTLDDIRRSIDAGHQERTIEKMELQLFPFLRQLREAFYFWGMIYPDKAEMERYYREEFAAHFSNFYVQDGKPPQYQVSVVVVAYNHLDMTKRCVESILKHTDFNELNAELILIDHGSTDGVLEYFESLGVGKVIHCKKNMRGFMFCILPSLCKSEFYVHVANDTVVTKDWLNILLTCAKSDPKIATVVPATCNISNLQALNVPVSDCEALVELAEKRNRSDPRLWNDRVRTLPAIGLFSIRVLNEIGFWDPMLYTFDFMDDDFSIRARRCGYRQILCEDVMCYHQGSATTKPVQAAEDTLGVGRKLFLEKHGVDAWGTGSCYDPYGIMQYEFTSGQEKPANILGLDCGFGDTVLEIRNQLRKKGREGKLYHITTDECFLPDLAPQSDEVLCAKPRELLSMLEHCFSNIQFDALFIGKDLTNYPEPYFLLDTLSRRMAPGGQLVFFFQNPYFAVRLHNMLQFSIPDSPVQLLHPEQVKVETGKYFSRVKMSGITKPIKGLEDFIIRHYGKEFLNSDQKQQLNILQYYAQCVK